MSDFDTTTHLAFLLAATCFVLGLHQMNTPRTARPSTDRRSQS